MCIKIQESPNKVLAANQMTKSDSVLRIVLKKEATPKEKTAFFLLSQIETLHTPQKYIAFFLKEGQMVSEYPNMYHVLGPPTIS